MSKVVKSNANEANTWLATNNTNKKANKPRLSKRALSMVKGKENSVTAQAYTVMMRPVWATSMSKLLAMLDNKPTGTNSVVLKINAAIDKVMTANHECSGRSRRHTEKNEFIVIEENTAARNSLYCCHHDS